MADTRLYIQAQTFTLAVGISTTDTSITLTSFNFPDGTAIASGDVGSVNYGTLEAGTTREEQISFTGFTANGDGTVTLTGVTRGLGFGAVDTYSEQADLKKQHGAGSTFIISNNPAFYDEFVNKYNDETISGTLTVPTPTASGHAVTKAYADALVTAGLDQNKVVVSGTAGESVTAGDLLYFDDTDNEWKKTDADTASTINNVVLGIAQGTGSDGVAITDGVLLYGQDETQTGMTPGAVYYASNTAGAISASAGTNERKIGWASEATVLYFDPYHGNLLTSDEQNALAGGGDFGTPSSSNKFATEDFITAQNFGGYATGISTSATSTIAHGLGYTPSRIRIHATCNFSDGSYIQGSGTSVGTYDGTNTYSIYESHFSADGSSSPENQGASSGSSSTYIVYCYNQIDAAVRRATVTLDATNINLTWSTSGTPAPTANILWEVFK